MFFKEISGKRERERETRIQADREFEQNELKKLNKKYKVKMLSSRDRGGKEFAAEQKIKEL